MIVGVDELGVGVLCGLCTFLSKCFERNVDIEPRTDRKLSSFFLQRRTRDRNEAVIFSSNCAVDFFVWRRGPISVIGRTRYVVGRNAAKCDHICQRSGRMLRAGNLPGCG